MQNNLVIVESPAKARTIEKFLGSGYKVMSSYGHIRDLKKKSFSIDVDHGFAPIYEVPADKKKLVAQLKAEADSADMVWLASDEDREGEAIAWHLQEVLKLKKENTRRIVNKECDTDTARDRPQLSGCSAGTSCVGQNCRFRVVACIVEKDKTIAFGRKSAECGCKTYSRT